MTVSLEKAIAKAEAQVPKTPQPRGPEHFMAESHAMHFNAKDFPDGKLAPPAPATPVKPLPTAPTTKLQDKDLVSPAEPSATPSQAAAAAPATPKKSLLTLIEEHFVQVDDLRSSGSHYPWRGRCKKCGWHTHQFTREDAFLGTRSHAQTHWRDVQRFM
jgi:hypothetical protein